MALSNVAWKVEWARSSPGSTDTYDNGLYGTATYDGGTTNLFWQDASSDVMDVSTRGGKDAFGKKFRTETGRLTLSDVNGTWAKPEAGFTPGDWVRITVGVLTTAGGTTSVPITPGTTWQGDTGRTWTANGNLVLDGVPIPPGTVTYPVFYGRVNATRSIVRGGVDVFAVQLIGLFGALAVFDKDPGATVGADETTAARMQRLVEFVGSDWSTVTEYGTSKANMQATDLGQPALQMMQLTMESEGGDVWIRPDGTLGVGYRDWLTEATDSTTILWQLGGTTTGVPITNGTPTEELQLVINNAFVKNVGGLQQESVDGVSIARYSHRTWRRESLIANSDAQALYLANRFVNLTSSSRPRVRSVSVKVIDEQTALFAGGVKIGDLVTVLVGSSIRGWGNTYLTHVVGVEHEGTAGAFEWDVTVALDDAFVENVDGGFWYEAFSNGFALGGHP